MHPLNRFLSPFGLQLSKLKKDRLSPDLRRRFEEQLQLCESNDRGFGVAENIRVESGAHPVSGTDFQCIFASRNLDRIRPSAILDIGSHRLFILGLLAHSKVTTIDIRERNPFLANETVLTCDAKQLDLPDGSFDAVVSICALEHFGLGRYGDEFDLDGDLKAFGEMVRVLKPGGRLIFTTTITRGEPLIVFNVHRIYSYEMIEELCRDMEQVDEEFFSFRTGGFCKYEEVTMERTEKDIYCGCWRKQP